MAAGAHVIAAVVLSTGDFSPRVLLYLLYLLSYEPIGEIESES